MNTRFEEIVNVAEIGKTGTNLKRLGQLMALANGEQMAPAFKNPEQVCLIVIDMQNDFMDDGALGVPGSIGDVERLSRWIYANMDKIGFISASLDTHSIFQIFHPAWWIDKNGKHPDPFTVITVADLDNGTWRPILKPVESRAYLEGLAAGGRQVLCVWPYHCLQGTVGQAMEPQLSNMMYFYSVAKKSRIEYLVKGTEICTEMYGIIKPEFDPKGYINVDFLNKIQKYDKIVIAGESKSHCVLESIGQILDNFGANTALTSKVYILEDCMSSVKHPAIDFEAIAAAKLDEFKTKYHVNLVKSVDFNL